METHIQIEQLGRKCEQWESVLYGPCEDRERLVDGLQFNQLNSTEVLN